MISIASHRARRGGELVLAGLERAAAAGRLGGGLKTSGWRITPSCGEQLGDARDAGMRRDHDGLRPPAAARGR